MVEQFNKIKRSLSLGNLMYKSGKMEGGDEEGFCGPKSGDG